MDTTFNLSGRFLHSLDDKGRLALPSKIREGLRQSDKPDEVMALAARDGYVTLYPYEEWQKITAQIDAIAETPLRNAALHLFVARAETLAVDKVGRVLIPTPQRAEAGLEREVEVLGLSKKIEIWDRACLERQTALDAAHYEKIKNGLGIKF